MPPMLLKRTLSTMGDAADAVRSAAPDPEVVQGTINVANQTMGYLQGSANRMVDAVESATAELDRTMEHVRDRAYTVASAVEEAAFAIRLLCGVAVAVIILRAIRDLRGA